MKNCPVCMKPLSDDSKSCPQCGTSVSPAVYTATPVSKRKKKRGVNPVFAIIAIILVATIGLGVGFAGGLAFRSGSNAGQEGKEGQELAAPDEKESAAPENTEGPPVDDPDAPQQITLEIWMPKEDLGENQDGWLYERLKVFEQAHPEYVITWKVGVGDPAYKVKVDPATAADVYYFAADQMYSLVRADALAPIGGDYAIQVNDDNFDALRQAVYHTDGRVYGFPVSAYTWFMYYNKDIYTEADIRSLDTMVAKGMVSYPLDTGWQAGSFMLSNGAAIFGESGKDVSQGYDFGGQKTYDAVKAVMDLYATGNFINDEMLTFYEGMTGGAVHAGFAQFGDYEYLKKMLGDKLGVAVMPTFQCGGKEVQLRPFAMPECIGVNPNSDHIALATQLAAFLASEESQLARYEAWGKIPAARDLMENEAIVNDELAMAHMGTLEQAIFQCNMPEMEAYWAIVCDFNVELLEGQITPENYREKVDQLNETLNMTLSKTRKANP